MTRRSILQVLAWLLAPFQAQATSKDESSHYYIKSEVAEMVSPKLAYVLGLESVIHLEVTYKGKSIKILPDEIWEALQPPNPQPVWQGNMVTPTGEKP